MEVLEYKYIMNLRKIKTGFVILNHLQCWLTSGIPGNVMSYHFKYLYIKLLKMVYYKPWSVMMYMYFKIADIYQPLSLEIAKIDAQ